MKLGYVSALATVCLSTVLITGCATSFDSADSGPVPIPGVAISGTAFGGRQPVAGAHIYVLRATTGGYAGPGLAPISGGNSSNSLVNTGSGPDSIGKYVVTDANGKFSISSDYTCNAGDQVYLLSLGGDPGGGANSAVGLMAILGTCGSSFGSSTTVNMNEISTVAAAYAMAGYASDATHVGSTGNPNAITGMRNAFANANQLYDITSSAYTGHPSAPRSTTPGGATVPVQQINTLADILANCVNSSSGSTQCTTLFGAARSPLGTQPSDTASAAIFMAQSQHNVSPYAIGPTPPYTPYYSSAPNDFSIQLSFSGGGLATHYHYDLDQGVAIDANGNVWVVGYSNKLSEFSPLGVPVSSTGYNIGLASTGSAVSVEVDNATSPNVWVTDAINNDLIKYNIANNSASTVQSGGLPDDISFNASGNLWVSDFNGGLIPINATTNAIGTEVTGNGLGQSGVPAIADNGDIWVPNTAGGSSTGISLFTSTGAAIGDTSGTGAIIPQAIAAAADSSNNGWFVRFTNAYVVKVSVSGSTLTPTTYNDNGTGYPISLAIDGNGNVWISSRTAASQSNTPATENAILELNNSGTPLTGTTGFLTSPNSSEPASIAIDSSGNVWFNSDVDATLHEIIGAATPVDVPLAHAVYGHQVGARP